MSQNKKNESDIFKDIESGKYRDYLIEYVRKSTDEANNQKNSISYQKLENARFAKRENLPIAPITIKGFCTNGIISEKHSGFKEDDMLSFSKDGLVQYRIERPKFQKLLELLNKGYFKGIVCLCWDRISRNKGDDTILRKLMRRGVEVHFAYAKYDDSSSGALHMDIDGMFSQHHSRVTSEKVTISTRNNREKGICTYRAPIGYLNLGQMDNKPFDPDRAPVIRDMFELYATGKWSLSDLARYADEHNMKTLPMRRRRTKEELLDEDLDIKDIPKISRMLNENHVSRILRNPFYTGRIKDCDGRYIISISHEALINDELFNRVQEMLKKNQISKHYTDKLDLPFRGMIRCGDCRRSYTPYIKKGIYYYSSRCAKHCENSFRNFNSTFIIDQVKMAINNLYFTDEEILGMDEKISVDLAQLEEKRNRQLNRNERKERKIREELTYLRSNKLSLLKSCVYSPESYIEEEDKLYKKLTELTDKKIVSDEAMHQTMNDVQKLSELLKTIATYYDTANTREKEEVMNTLFSELSISNKTLKYKVQTGLECFEDRLNAVGDPIAWISELYKSREDRILLLKNLSDLIIKENQF